MLVRWESLSAVCLLGLQEEEQAEQEKSRMPAWSEQESPHREQAKHINHLMLRHRAAFATKPGRTERVIMKVETGEARPVGSTPYRVPHARKPVVQEEV